MIQYILFQIKYFFSKFSLNRKNEINERLDEAFGTTKEGSFDFDLIKKYFKNKETNDAHQVLSDRTCDDLDFNDLFMFLDRTHSKIGQQYLYNKLRTIHINKEQTQLNEDIINELTSDKKLRVSIQKLLEKLNHKDTYFITTLFQDNHITPPKWFYMIKILSLASVIFLCLSFFEPLFFIALLSVFCINFVIHFWNKKNLFQYVNSIPQLLKLNNASAILNKNSLLKKLHPDLSKSIKLINGVKNRSAFFQLETKLQADHAIVFWLSFEICKVLFLLEPLLLFGVLKRLDTKRKEIEAVFKFVGHIDMLISIASLRNGLDTFCLPTISKNNKIIASEISHPLIFNCTKNSITISEKSILLTGSNMSGKTSFIRAIGLNIITGLTINTCFAKSLEFPLLKIFSAIRITDDLMNDKSYYFQEVLTIKEIIAEGKKGNNLFLLDELFKGTNTVERIAAGKAILSNLNKNNNTVLVATHDLELTDMLSNEYELYHFSETVENNSVGFDYTLKEGKLKTRNAIRILDINEYPKEIVEDAFETSKELDELYLANKIC